MLNGSAVQRRRRCSSGADAAAAWRKLSHIWSAIGQQQSRLRGRGGPQRSNPTASQTGFELRHILPDYSRDIGEAWRPGRR